MQDRSDFDSNKNESCHFNFKQDFISGGREGSGEIVSPGSNSLN